MVVGESDTIGTTSNHPFWSVDHQEYVQAGKLVIGERLQTFSGDTKRVVSKLARPGPQPVFNLEVFAEHVYYVGKDRVLVHNAYVDDALVHSGQHVGSHLGRDGKMLARTGKTGLAGDHVIPKRAIENAVRAAKVSATSDGGRAILEIQDSSRNLRLMDSSLNSSKGQRNAAEWMSMPLGSLVPRKYIQNILRKQYKNAAEINIHLNDAGTINVNYFSDFFRR